MDRNSGKDKLEQIVIMLSPKGVSDQFEYIKVVIVQRRQHLVASSVNVLIQYFNLQQWETVTAGVLKMHLYKLVHPQFTPTQSDLETVHSSHKSLHHHNSQAPIQTPSDRHSSHHSIASAKEQLLKQINQASSYFIEPQFHEETYCEPASTHDNTHIKTSLSQGVVRKQLITKQQKSLTSSNPALSDHVVAVPSVGEQSKTRNGHFQYRNASLQTGTGNSQKISQSQSPMPNIAKLTRREEREKVLKEGEVLKFGCGLRNAQKGSFVARLQNRMRALTLTQQLS